MRSFGAASVLFAVTVFGAADETVAQAFVPTHENIMEYAKATVHAMNDGVPPQLKLKSGLTDDELTELGEDLLLEILTQLDTEDFLALIGDAMKHHVLGDAPEKSGGMPSLERLLTEERRLAAERVSGTIEKISKAHDGIDRRRIVCGGLCIGLTVAGGIFSAAGGLFGWFSG